MRQERRLSTLSWTPGKDKQHMGQEETNKKRDKKIGSHNQEKEGS
jgi:hypothetical protein